MAENGVPKNDPAGKHDAIAEAFDELAGALCNVRGDATVVDILLQHIDGTAFGQAADVQALQHMAGELNLHVMALEKAIRTAQDAAYGEERK